MEGVEGIAAPSAAVRPALCPAESGFVARPDLPDPHPRACPPDPGHKAKSSSTPGHPTRSTECSPILATSQPLAASPGSVRTASSFTLLQPRRLDTDPQPDSSKMAPLFKRRPSSASIQPDSTPSSEPSVAPTSTAPSISGSPAPRDPSINGTSSPRHSITWGKKSRRSSIQSLSSNSAAPEPTVMPDQQEGTPVK